MSASVLLTRVVLEAAAGAGAAPEAIAAASGLDLARLADPDARIPHALQLAVWREAARASNDDAFGLRVARMLPPPAYGAVGYAIANSKTLGEAWARLVRFSRLLYDEVTLDLESDADHASFTYDLEANDVAHVTEGALASIVENARRLTGATVSPVRVTFRHPGRPRGLPAFFGAPVSFGQRRSAVVFARAILEHPLRNSDPGLAAVLERHAADLLARLPPDADVVGEVTRALHVLLPDGRPSASAVASRLGIGQRTLQRRLRERGVSFAALLDNVRRELALAYLATPGTPIAAVSFALGFSDTAAFTKAFRRWTGQTPGAFRESFTGR